ncbi:hypothetical protein M1394_01560 [Candidatus Marsarchaeota archaeon]|nr:hypothetical protein [Candidatus Marsarchaeota archaeon]
MKQREKTTKAASDIENNIRLYAIVAAFLVLISISAFLMIPGGSQLNKCISIVLSQDRYACMSSLALSTNNASICGRINGSYGAACYLDLAETYANVTLCGHLSSSDRVSCVMNVSYANQNYHECGMLYGENESACMQRIALNTYDPSICNEIPNMSAATECLTSLRIVDALVKNNASYCSSLPANSNSSSTASIFAALSSHNLSRSMNIYMNYLLSTENGTITPKDFCYYSIGISAMNQSDCLMISNQSTQESCSSQVVQINNSTYANMTAINYTKLINSCISAGLNSTCSSIALAHALADMNMTQCSQLPHNMSSTCYMSIAEQLNNVSDCSYIRNASLNYLCVMSVNYNSSS